LRAAEFLIFETASAPRKTKLAVVASGYIYDRRHEELSLDEVERIRV
jgi:hypothetical protein